MVWTSEEINMLLLHFPSGLSRLWILLLQKTSCWFEVGYPAMTLTFSQRCTNQDGMLRRRETNGNIGRNKWILECFWVTSLTPRKMWTLDMNQLFSSFTFLLNFTPPSAFHHFQSTFLFLPTSLSLHPPSFTICWWLAALKHHTWREPSVVKCTYCCRICECVWGPKCLWSCNLVLGNCRGIMEGCRAEL